MEPNRLSAPGEHAARERVEALFARIDEIGVVPLLDTIVSAADPDHRDELLLAVDRTAARHGRTELLDEALDTVRDALLASVASRWPAGTYVGQARSSARVEDRVAAQRAIEDAVAVAVVEDVLDREVAQELADPGRAILGLPPLGEIATGLAAISGEIGVPAPPPDWAPSDADWAEADRGITAVRRGERSPIPGWRSTRMLVIGVLVVTGVLGSIAWTMAQSGPPFGLLAAAVVVLVGWTFAFPPRRD